MLVQENNLFSCTNKNTIIFAPISFMRHVPDEFDHSPSSQDELDEIALSLYLEVFMKSLSAQLGLKFYFYMVLFLGGITVTPRLLLLPHQELK